MLVLGHLAAAMMVATLLSVTALILRRRIACPVARYRLGVLTLGLMVALPLVQVGLAAMLTGPAPDTRFVSAVQVFGRPAPTALPATVATSPAMDAAEAAATSVVRQVDVRSLLLWLYAAVVIGVIAWTSVRAALTWRLVGATEPVCDEHVLEAWHRARCDVGVRRRVRLLSSRRISTPASWAFGGWSVLLPARLKVDDARQLRCVLVHELTHLVRRDHWLLLTRFVVAALYWPSPPVWLLCRAVSVDCELSCDRLVVTRTGSARAYAHALLTAATGGPDRLLLATSMSGGRRDLTWRITMLSRTNARMSSRKQALAAAAIVLAGVAGAAASAGALPLGAADPPEVIIMHAPEVERDFVFLGGRTMRGVDFTEAGDQPGPSMILQETVLNVSGMRMRDGRIITETVDLNLPENSRLGARLEGRSVMLAPADEGATITIVGGSIAILDLNGETRIRASVGASDALRAVCRVIADEYNFSLEATDESGQAVPITVHLHLGEHEDPGVDHQGWVLLPEDGRYRVKMRRHGLSGQTGGATLPLQPWSSGIGGHAGDGGGQNMGGRLPGMGGVGQSPASPGDGGSIGGGRDQSGRQPSGGIGGGGGGAGSQGGATPGQGLGGGRHPGGGGGGGGNQSGALPGEGPGDGLPLSGGGGGGGNQGGALPGEGPGDGLPLGGSGGGGGGGGGGTYSGTPEQNSQDSGVPLLSDLPLIGFMFSLPDG